MRIFITLVSILIVFSGSLYLSKTYGHSEMHIDADNGYCIEYVAITWTDTILLAIMMTGLLMIPIVMAIHYYYEVRE